MIPTYSHYILAFVARKGADEGRRPGEHHFVATYLVPRLFALHPAVPDFVYPRGTKAVQGAIVYLAGGQHRFGIEIKCEQVRLNPREYNTWIVGRNRGKWPNVFIGICRAGLVVADWDSFRTAYIDRAKRATPNWRLRKISSGHGRLCSVNALKQELPTSSWFDVERESGPAKAAEDRLIASLAQHLQSLISYRLEPTGSSKTGRASWVADFLTLP